MAAVLMILSGFLGFVGAILAWYLDGGLIVMGLAYAVSGNVSFLILTALFAARNSDTPPADYLEEYEADLQALLEERYQRMMRAPNYGHAYWAPLLRRVVTEGSAIPARERRLFRA
ncbi:hypothetical protein HOY34_14425 [Xinfangfangia sp. D13-10-4-6]|uniref:hypothetical protein n=1 Tax=Pseudogemmobacter hezensis TaxID=2737662 RepID=UPI0015535984|nr:hypothetical protein [Pseudogemmobacter hezensis]NPD16392.1 hypothetical protein [Pseudogemmobacter hezensis]